MTDEIISRAIRLAVASGLLSWPLALLAVVAVAVLMVVAPRVWDALPPGIIFPRVEIPEPEVAPPLVVSPDGTIPLDQKPMEPQP